MPVPGLPLPVLPLSEPEKEDIMDLQMGRKYNAFFSRNLRDLDRQNTQSLKTTMQFSPIPENYIGFDILTRHADAFVRNTGARIIIMDNSERGFHRLNEDWEQYYNPLEK